MSIIDLPAALARAVTMSWTMEHGHGIASSPYSGITQSQRGSLERFRFTMRLARLTRAQAQAAQGFFLNLEGNLNTFRMSDPACPTPLGKAIGLPVLASGTSPGDRTLSTTGWTPNVPGILKAGDWIQLGDQLCKVRTDADSSATGTATLDVWPKIWQTHAASTSLVVRQPAGIFRFTSDFPEWALSNDNIRRPYEIQLTGIQEILTD